MKSLLARLLLIVSLALVPALAFQAYTESQARRFRQHLVEDEAMRLVRLVSSEQQRIIDAAEQVLEHAQRRARRAGQYSRPFAGACWPT